MTNTIAGILLGSLLGYGFGKIRSEFYRAYFYQKQRNAGKDPVSVIRREFPILWWWIQ